MKKQLVKLSTHLEKCSPFYLGFDIKDLFPETISNYKFDTIFLVTDKRMAFLYKQEIEKTLKNLNYKTMIISGSESEKNMNTLNYLCEELLDKGITKESIIIAFGGGVIGNIVGLAAALIYRGVRFVEMPTTFMAQTDGTLSNKQAVNGKTNKNLLGCYYAPLFIWSDTKYVHTESESRIKCGLVESIKNGFIHNKSILKLVDRFLVNDLKDSNALYDIIHQSILSKLEIIQKDPSEKGYGMILEYGHTFGHAIERLSQGQKPHGECVAIGMLIAASVSRKLGMLTEELYELHREYLKDKMKINLTIPSDIAVDKIIETIKSDNKKTGKGIRYVLLEGLNKIHNPEGDFMVSLEEKVVRESIHSYMKEYNNLSYETEPEPCVGSLE